MQRFSSIFIRSVISFVSIVLLATSLLSLYFTQRMSATQYEAQVAKYDEALVSLCDLLDDRFYDYLSYANIVNVQKELRPFFFSADDVLSHKDIIEALSHLKSSNRTVIDIGLYYIAGERYISAIASFDNDSFVKHYYHFSGLGGEDYLEMLKDPREVSQDSSIPVIIPVGKATRMDSESSIDTLLILYPIPYWSKTPYATMSVIVDAKSMLKQLLLAAGDGSAYITNAMGQVVLRYDANPDAEADPASLRIFQASSDKFNLTYTIEVQESALSANSPYQAKLYFMIVGIMLLLSICGLFFAIWIYRPMQRLVSNIDGSSRFIRDEASVILKHISDLNAHVARNQQLVDELVLRRLIAGQRLPQGVDLQQQSDTLALDYGHSTIFAVKLAQPVAQAIAMTRVELPKAAVYVVQGERMDMLLGVLSTDESEPERLMELVRQILQDPMFDKWTVAAIGPAQEDLPELGRSSLYAQSTLVELVRQGKEGIFCADDLPAQEAAYPSDAIHALQSALAARDASLLRAAGLRLRSYLQDPSVSQETAALVAYDLAGMLPAMDMPASAPSLCDALDAQIGIVIDSFSEPVPAAPSDEHLLDIMQRIDEQLENPDFGISYIAQQYGMSDSAFSHMFKRSFDVSFINYVNRKKIHRAKKLLKESSLSIDEIARRMGYSSASNFTRMFRSIEQITPSLYRKMNSVPSDDSIDE